MAQEVKQELAEPFIELRDTLVEDRDDEHWPSARFLQYNSSQAQQQPPPVEFMRPIVIKSDSEMIWQPTEIREDGSEVYQCQACSHSFPDGESLTYHIKASHLSSKEPVSRLPDFDAVPILYQDPFDVLPGQEEENARPQYFCPHCPKKYLDKYKFHRHLKYSHPDDPQEMEKLLLPCDQCPKKFIVASELKTHVAEVHDKVRPFQCSQCDKGFIRNCYLEDHVRAVHLKERPFQCEYCNKAFSRKRCFKDHMENVHKDEIQRPYLYE